MSIDCINHVIFIHDLFEECERLVMAGMRGNLFREFVPLSTDNSWTACRALWGVKWDARVESLTVDRAAGNICVRFITANVPPMQFIEHMNFQGWRMQGHWWIPADACGRYHSDGSEHVHEDVCNEPVINISTPADVDKAITIDQDLLAELHDEPASI